jgi:hypothetical protein
VNKLQPYERSIAGKLQQRPVPDMADSIWANIEKGLDADPPPDNGPSKPPCSPGRGSDIVKGLGLIVILAIVVIMFTVRKKNTDHIPSKPAVIVPVHTTTADTHSAATPFISPGNTRSQQLSKKPGNIITDSSLNIDPVINSLQDSMANKPLIIQPRIIDSVQALPKQQVPAPGKKTRGVKLNDSDYKIIQLKKNP